MTIISIEWYIFIGMKNESEKNTDVLTGLASREAFDADFAQWVTQAKRKGISVSLAVMDIDWFGRLNKTHGRDIGDALLCVLAQETAQAFQKVGRAYRFGGDAVAVLCNGMEKEAAFILLEQFRQAFDATHRVEQEKETLEVAMQISCGVAAYPDDGAKAKDIVNKASEALYRAKVSGRNKVCLPREEKMVTKTSHYTQGQLMGLRRLAERESIGEAVLLREALNDILRKYNA